MAQCSTYVDTKESQGFFLGKKKRCPDTATVWLVDPQGNDVPGGYMCDKHAQSCITQYRMYLGETWSTRPLTDIEKI